MPPGTILQLLVGLVALALLFLTWWIKNHDEIKKKVNDEDKKIDAVSDADDTLIELDRLRQPPANRP